MTTTLYTPFAREVSGDEPSHSRAYQRARCIEAVCGGIGVGGIVVWSVFTVVALVQTAEHMLVRTCPHTPLWRFLLVALLVSVALLALVAAYLADSVRLRARTRRRLATAWFLLLFGINAWGLVCIRDECARDRLSHDAVLRLSRAWVVTVSVGLALTIAVLGSGAIKTCPACGCSRARSLDEERIATGGRVFVQNDALGIKREVGEI